MWYLIVGVPILIGGAVWLSAASRQISTARAKAQALRLEQRQLFLRPKQAASGDGKRRRGTFGRR